MRGMGKIMYLPDDVFLCMRDKESEYGADGLQKAGE